MKRYAKKTMIVLALFSVLACLSFFGCEQENCKEEWETCFLDSECCSPLTCTDSVCQSEE